MKNNNKKGFKPNKKKVTKPANAHVIFQMFEGGIAGKREYDVASLVALLHQIPFEKISIPVIASRKLVTGDDSKTGTTQIGYINKVLFREEYEAAGYKDEDIDADVMFDFDVFPRFTDILELDTSVEHLWEIYPRLLVSDKGEIKTIIGFELIDMLDTDLAYGYENKD